jgi:hypothetical protein
METHHTSVRQSEVQAGPRVASRPSQHGLNQDGVAGFVQPSPPQSLTGLQLGGPQLAQAALRGKPPLPPSPRPNVSYPTTPHPRVQRR